MSAKTNPEVKADPSADEPNLSVVEEVATAPNGRDYEDLRGKKLTKAVTDRGLEFKSKDSVGTLRQILINDDIEMAAHFDQIEDIGSIGEKDLVVFAKALGVAATGKPADVRERLKQYRLKGAVAEGEKNRAKEKAEAGSTQPESKGKPEAKGKSEDREQQHTFETKDVMYAHTFARPQVEELVKAGLKLPEGVKPEDVAVYAPQTYIPGLRLRQIKENTGGDPLTAAEMEIIGVKWEDETHTDSVTNACFLPARWPILGKHFCDDVNALMKKGKSRLNALKKLDEDDQIFWLGHHFVDTPTGNPEDKQLFSFSGSPFFVNKDGTFFVNVFSMVNVATGLLSALRWHAKKGTPAEGVREALADKQKEIQRRMKIRSPRDPNKWKVKWGMPIRVALQVFEATVERLGEEKSERDQIANGFAGLLGDNIGKPSHGGETFRPGDQSGGGGGNRRGRRGGGNRRGRRGGGNRRGRRG